MLHLSTEKHLKAISTCYVSHTDLQLKARVTASILLETTEDRRNNHFSYF